MKALKWFLILGALLLLIGNVAAPAIAADNDSLVVTETGNVGIGTTTPNTKLQIMGDCWVGNDQSTSNGFVAHGTDGGFFQLKYGASWNSRIKAQGDKIASWQYYDTQWQNGLTLNNGNVGIGTANPLSKLQVNGTIRLSNSDPFVLVDSDAKYLAFSGGSGGVDTGAALLMRGKSAANNAYGLEIYSGGAERIRVVSNGNVGIGNASPIEKLDVTGNAKVTGNVTATGSLTAASSTISGNLIANGNVGIGKTPTVKLDVNGSAKVSGTLTAQTISATTYVGYPCCTSGGGGPGVPGGGPDYVFAPDYELDSLDYIAAYVKENRHLPKVPSADEMEKNGVNLMSQTMLHLEKIEELTLHLIALKNENDQLKNLVKQLAGRIDSIESRTAAFSGAPLQASIKGANRPAGTLSE
jgi:hypothetical protein